MLIKQDSSDIMFYEDYKSESPDMQKSIQAGTENHYAFDSLASDVYSMFYKANPQFVEGNMPAGFKIARQALEQVQNCREFKDLSMLTKLDNFASGFATNSMLSTLSSYLPPTGSKSPEDITNEIQALEDLAKINPKLSQEANKQAKDLKKQLEKIDSVNKTADSVNVPVDDLRGIVRKALQDAAQATQEGLEALAALGQGTGAGSASNASLAEKMAVAKRVKDSKKLKEIMHIAGRMIRIARKKQAEKHTSTEYSDIEMGDSINRLLPSETSKLNHPALKTLFYKGLADKALLQYKLSGKEHKGQGPIIICVDSSSSMSSGGAEYASKGIVLAMLEIARAQKRSFVLIQFASRHEIREFKVENGNCNTMDLLTEIEFFFNGGTNFEQPLYKALDHMHESKYKESSVIFLTDGAASVSDNFLKEYHYVKKALNFHTFGIGIGCSEEPLKPFCDDSVSIGDLLNDSGYQERIFKV